MAYGTIDTSSASDAGLFAVPAFLITFRETLEAAIIVSVLLGLLSKLEQPHLRKYVWIGVLSASMLCIGLGVIFLILLNVLKETFLEGNTILVVEGILSVIAAILIGVVAVTIGNIMSVHAKWERKLSSGLEAGEVISKRSILFLSFTAVLREGVETIIFFTGIGAAYPIESLPIPAVVGAVVGAILGVLLYKCGGKMTIQWFFRFTMVLLVFIGAGVFTNGISSLQASGAFGTWDPEDERPPLNVVLWDISECCGLDVSEFWVLMRVLFGYTPSPTGLEILFYLLFHACVWSIIIVRVKLSQIAEERNVSVKMVLKEKLFGSVVHAEEAKVVQDEENPVLQ